MKKMIFCLLIASAFSQTSFASSLKSEKLLSGKVLHAKCDLGGGDSYNEDFRFIFDARNNDVEMRANGLVNLEKVSEEISADKISIKTPVYRSNEGHLGNIGKFRQSLEISLNNGVPSQIKFRTYDLTLVVPIPVNPKYDCTVTGISKE